jgi:Holliday junction resolvase RusA-like endonuclease
MKFDTTININPTPASRPRVTKAGHSYYAKSYADFKKVFKEIVRLKTLKTKPFEGAVLLSTTFYIGIPKSTSKKDTEILDNNWHTKKPDFDNLIKAIADGLNGLVYKDDGQVAVSNIKKLWTKGTPKIKILCKPLQDRKKK